MNARADASPDFLAGPKKGKGVRRLNRLPLFIVGGLVLLAVIGLVYTMSQKSGGAQSGAAGVPEMVVVAEPPPAPVQPEPEPPQPEPLPREPLYPAQAAGRLPGRDHAAELEQRMRLIARVEEKRLIAQEAALDAEPVVAGFARRTGASNQPANPASGGNLPGLPAGLPPPPQPPAMPQLDLAALGGLGGLGGLDNASEAPFDGSLLGFGDPNRQDEKRAFLANAPQEDVYLPHTRLPALAQAELKAGTVIPGVMIGGINSDLPGQIIGQVRQNIYDTASGLYLLIPAGARLIGTYDSSVTMGQRRVLVAWNRIIFPDGSSVSLDRMPGADVSGYAGFQDKINNHYWRIFGNAFMLSLFSAGIQLSQPDPQPGFYHDNSQVLAAEIGQQLGRLGSQIAQRNLSIQPTLEVRPGYQFTIMVTKDMILPPWQGHPLATGQR